MCLYCYLWDYGEPGSQILESNLGNINTINNNSSSSSLQDAEQSQSQRGFASTSAANDTNLKVWRMVNLMFKSISYSFATLIRERVSE